MPADLVNPAFLADPSAASAGGQEELLQSIEDLREFFRDYADLMQDTWSVDAIAEEKRTLILFHQGLFAQHPSPADKLGRVADVYRRLLDVIKKEQLAFRIPTRAALLPESDNVALLATSERMRELNAPLEGLVAQVRTLAAPPAGEIEERIRSLHAGVASLFKGVVRQDWEDVDLVLNHINLVTTSAKSRGLVHQIAQLARDIYNSLNDFSAEYRVEELSQSAQEIPDAVEKLRSVIKRLEAYANANLDTLEALNRELREDRNLIEQAGVSLEECLRELDALAQADPALAEGLRETRERLAGEVAQGLAALLERLRQNEEAYLGLIANMSFQDLTGQTLKKVIAFIEQLEFQLLKLISRYRDEGMAPARPEPVTPLAGPDARGPLALNQESVDKMLADLGF